MKKEPELNAVTWLAAIVVTCVILFVFQKILWLAVPAIAALVFYYCLRPLVKASVRTGLSHRTAARLVSAVLFLATVLTVVLLLPVAANRAPRWKASAIRYLQGGLDFVARTEQVVAQKLPLRRDGALLRNTPTSLESVTEQLVEKHLGTLLLQIVHWLPALLLTPYLTYFLLQDGNGFKKRLIRNVPNAFFEKTLLLVEQIDLSLQNFFVGLIKLTFLDTVCLGLGLWVLGISSPLLLGLMAAVLAWIPYVGSAVGCIIVGLAAATDFPNQPAMTYGSILLFVAVRLLDDFVFLPLTIGRSLRIHPVMSVLMLFLGAAVAGPTGLVLVLPVLGIVAVASEIIGQIIMDPCLRERFRQARRLRAIGAAMGG